MAASCRRPLAAAFLTRDKRISLRPNIISGYTLVSHTQNRHMTATIQQNGSFPLVLCVRAPLDSQESAVQSYTSRGEPNNHLVESIRNMPPKTNLILRPEEMRNCHNRLSVSTRTARVHYAFVKCSSVALTEIGST
jgi:hypothetical protein